MTDVVVRTKHARRLGFCSSGIKAHCERHGFDFRRFILEGLPAEELEGIDNHYIAMMVREARREAEES